MLNTLIIKNIAIIKQLQIQFERGLTVLSGETGAGKSIIVDSLNFLLGAKTDRTLLKSGEKEAVVEGVFLIEETTSQKLIDFGMSLEDDKTMIITRTLTDEGKTDCRLNGKLITLSMLRNITESMVDIHGQHEHQSLLKPSSHLKLLDVYTENIVQLKNQVADIYHKFKKCVFELQSFGMSDAERERMLDVIKFQINEIQAASLKEEEEEELANERLKIINAERIAKALGLAYDNLSGTEGASGNITQALNALNQITKYDTAYDDIYKRLESARYEIDDIVMLLNDKVSDTDYDERAADKIESRIDLIKNMKRKYGATIAEIKVFLDKATREYERLTTSTETILKLQKEKDKLANQLYEAAYRLSESRRAGAAVFSSAVQKELNDLGMEGSLFETIFSDIPSRNDFETLITADGFDKAEFYLSANKGEPLKPLAKIASGGEMSRIMLALKVILSQIDDIDTMIFDEIDTGISGRIGQTIANKLAHISRNRQVITITHLASICAMADFNYLIYKDEYEGKTLTKVIKLNDDDTLGEIARLSGGKDISKLSYEHSKELKNWSNAYKERFINH